MILRPASAHWFELLTSREELGPALDCLAATGLVQLQAYSRSESRLGLPDLRNTLTEYETLARSYGHLWPPARRQRLEPDDRLLEAPREACARLQAWAAEAAPVIAELESLQRLREETNLIARLHACAGDQLPRLDRIASAGPMLAGRIYALQTSQQPHAMPPSVMTQLLRCEGQDFMLAVGPSGDIDELDSSLGAREARILTLPAELPADSAKIPAFIETRSRSLKERERTARAALDQLGEKHRVAEATGQLALAAWLVANVPELPVTEHFAWITGWCADKDDTRLKAALDQRDLHYLLRFTAAPEGEQAPSVLHNPAWARPFELFAGLMGVPASRDADPSIVVALIAPVMFGFMFGDVAHGAILAVAGLLLQKKFPALRLLIPGGLFSVGFGFAFGSVLAREDLIPALWLRPLEEPLVVLGTALGFGVVVIAMGLTLNALQFFWRGEGKRWLAVEAGLNVAYLGLVGAALDLRALWAVPVGIAWTLLGAAMLGGTNRVNATAHAAGEFVERILQLAVNTLSFVRVGAFALAHAGLGIAVVGIAEAAGAGYWPVLLLGNAVIIVLEGLVVGIQTTRLVLFEFFIRFLTAGGRSFQPLPPPAQTSPPISGSKP